MKNAYRALAILALIAPAGFAYASTATYTEFAYATGSFAGAAFTDQLVTFTFTGDTSTIVLFKGSPELVPLTAVVQVGVLPSATLTGPLVLFDNDGSAAAGFRTGLPTTNGSDILDTSNAAFATYALATSIGPDSGAATINPGTAFATGAGNLVLNSVIGNATFQASVPTSPVPEPAELLLTTLGLLGLSALRRWR